MTEDRLRKMVTGAVVGATTTIVLLLTILGFLLGSVVSKKIEENRLDAEYTELLQKIEAGEESLEYYTSQDGIDYLLYKYKFFGVEEK